MSTPNGGSDMWVVVELLNTMITSQAWYMVMDSLGLEINTFQNYQCR